MNSRRNTKTFKMQMIIMLKLNASKLSRTNSLTAISKKKLLSTEKEGNNRGQIEKPVEPSEKGTNNTSREREKWKRGYSKKFIHHRGWIQEDDYHIGSVILVIPRTFPPSPSSTLPLPTHTTPPSPLPANSSKARQSPPFQIRGISQHPSIHTHIKAYSPHYRLSQIYTHACLFSFAFSCRFSLLTVFLLIDIETLAEASKSNSCTIHSFVEKVDSLFQITFFYLY